MAMNTRMRGGLALLAAAALAGGTTVAASADPGNSDEHPGGSVAAAFNNVGITDASTLANGQLDATGVPSAPPD